MINLIGNTGLIIVLIVFIVVIGFFLWVNIRYKKFLEQQIPVAHIKEKLSMTDVTIKCYIGFLLILCIALIIILLI